MKLFLIPLIGAALLAGCATSDEAREKEPRGVAAFEGDARLGEQVDKICFSGNIDGFSDTGRDTVVLSQGVRNDYLVVVKGICPSLRHAKSVGIDNFGSCVGRSDALIVSEDMFLFDDREGFGPDRCLIDSIYKWDRDADMAGEASGG